MNATDKTRGKNPNGFRSRTTSKPGSNCGATGFRGGRVAHRPWGQVVLRPHPLPSLYRWPGGPWGAIRGVGSRLGLPNLPTLPTPSHRKPAIFGFWYSHLEEDSLPLVRPHLLGRPGKPRWLSPQG